jgi:hypothetical protein
METIFSAASLLVFPFWALMVFAPGWRRTRSIIASPWIAIGPALVYAALAIPELPSLLVTVSDPNLPEVRSLLGTERGATLGWMHFLAFDLFAGRWIYLDAREREISALVTSPLLVLTLLLGPLGLTGYLATRRLTGARERVPATAS